MGMRMSARGASKVASKARKLSNFGKCWSVGDKGIVIYPIYFDEESGKVELLVCSEWGYRVNSMDELGLKVSFIPSNAEINDDGVPVVPDITSQFSRLAPAIIAGEKAIEEANINSKTWPTMATKMSKLQELDKLYDTKNNPNARKAVVGRLCLLITTECIYVPIKNENPDWDNARLVAQSLSTSKINKLMTIIDDPLYGVTKDSPYLEVQYNFTAADGLKSTAGKNDPVGINAGYHLFERFPDSAKRLEELVAQLPVDSDIIRNHNYSYMHLPEAQLRSVFQAYCISKSECIDSVPEDYEEAVVRASKLIDDLSLTGTIKNTALHDKITAAIAAESTEAPTLLKDNDPIPSISDDSDTPGGLPPVDVLSGAPTIEQILGNGSSGNEKVSDLLSNPNLADAALADAM